MRYGLAVILIIIFAIIASIVLLGRGSSKPNPAKQSRVTTLADYADKESSSISWTMQGRLVGEDQYRAVRVTVTRHTRTVEILDGYENTTERQNEFSNTPDAYQAFMRALDIASFGKERVVKLADERGVCPLGNRFIYRLQDGNKEVMRTWSDNCLITDGPSAGNTTLIGQLFKNQITDYSKFTSNLQF